MSSRPSSSPSTPPSSPTTRSWSQHAKVPTLDLPAPTRLHSTPPHVSTMILTRHAHNAGQNGSCENGRSAGSIQAYSAGEECVLMHQFFVAGASVIRLAYIAALDAYAQHPRSRASSGRIAPRWAPSPGRVGPLRWAPFQGLVGLDPAAHPGSPRPLCRETRLPAGSSRWSARAIARGMR